MPAEALALVFGVLLASGTANPQDATPPEPELLEFLADFGTGTNEWLDPLSLDTAVEQQISLPPEQKRRTEKPHD